MDIQPDLFDPVWYTVKSLAAAMGISMVTLMRWVNSGRIPPPQRWGYHTLRWHKDDVVHAVRHGPMPKGTYSPKRPPPLPELVAAKAPKAPKAPEKKRKAPKAPASEKKPRKQQA